ncbi:hypothetical protein M9Y10_044032 [Tritrichomonas musculus]|uniref:P-type phospholipid transporter n=1 Tax=Tritrichomonas musculus TaxID=1915356 RepID=A0ABR2K1C0_9EUKA
MYRKLTAEQTSPSPRVINYPECQEKFSPNIIKTSHYTWYNFIFLNLFEQFHRFANIFFLFLAIIQAIPAISPLNQLAGFVQLTFMLSITAVKNAYEDILRHKTDKEVNDRLVPIYNHQANRNEYNPSSNDTNIHLLTNDNDQFSYKKWSDLNVSDVIRIDPNSEAPADCLVIETVSNDNKCRIETSALDGETFLKFRYPVFKKDLNNSVNNTLFNNDNQQNSKSMETRNLTKDDHFVIQVSPPTSNLKTFSGKIICENNETIPISLSNFVPRGCISRDKKSFLAIVVYTGDDTKLIMNSMKPRFKFTELDQIMSKMAFILLIAMFIICFIMTLCGKVWKDHQLNPKNGPVNGYLKSALDDNQHWFLQFFSWIIDLQMIIPLAVYSSLDVVRFLLSFNISMDDQMTIEIKNEKSDQKPDFDYTYSNNQKLNTHSKTSNDTLLKKSKCRNSDLVSSIGRITHIFTDKTGTLTKNLMTFRSAIFSKFELTIEKADDTSENLRTLENCEEVDLDFFNAHSMDDSDIWHFLMTIILCNSVEVIDHQYVSNSPDELALLEFAKKCQFELIESSTSSGQNSVLIKVRDILHEVERPLKFEFNSNRKRSSALCKIDGRWKLLVKGADSVMIPRCKNYGTFYEERLEELGRRGLRTLCFAYKELNEKEVTSLLNKYQVRSSLTVSSEESLEDLANSIESDLTIYAFSGVEDELQDQIDVTLEQIRQANIHVWMLTGDRLDTAIDVGRNCGLISPFNSIITVKVSSQNIDQDRPNDNDNSNFLKSDILNHIEILIDGEILNTNGENENGMAVDVENSVLCVDDADTVLNDLCLFGLANRCRSVIIARCEPLQKGNVLRLFKENVKTIERIKSSNCTLSNLNSIPIEDDTPLKNWQNSISDFYSCSKKDFESHPIVLAIGDGVNDVDMIRVSDVGVAVEGREGSAAVLSSDFSIPTFSKLSNLLLIHGRYNCIRTSLLILVTFYKNLLLGMPQMFYGFFNGFSATSIFDSGFFALYNVVLTIPQHFAACVIEEDVDSRLCLKYPFVYRDFQKNGGFSFLNVFWFYFISFLHSSLLFFVPYFALNLCVLNDGIVTFNHSLFTQIVGWSLMSVFTYEMFHVFHTITVFQAVLNFVCFLSNFAIQYFYSFVESEYDSILSRSAQASLMWFTIPLIVGSCIIVDLVKEVILSLKKKKSFTDLVIMKENH